MGDGTKIEWTDATWNPITGCTVVSPGCANCYAMKLAGGRLKNHWSRKGLTEPSKAGPVWNGKVRFNGYWLEKPLEWQRPRLIFVCAHGDPFHPDVPDPWLIDIWAVMAAARQHHFQVLTKRSARMLRFLSDHKFVELIKQRLAGNIERANGPAAVDDWFQAFPFEWPLPNVWAGVSIEDQKRADERLAHLAETQAAVRFVSAEPLLGPVDFPASVLRKIHWVIVGGESGPGSRPMHPNWARSLRDQCQAAGVPFFFKQWGDLVTEDQSPEDIVLPGTAHCPWSTWNERKDDWAGDQTAVYRVGKKAAGALLDGELHQEWPRGLRAA